METRLESGQDLKNAAREGAQQAADAMQSAKTSLQEKSAASARATDRTIRQHPYESLGVAFGLGLLIGVLINRR